MAEMAWVLEGRLLVVANTEAPVPPEEWSTCVQDIAAHAKHHWALEPRILVFTEGGGPDAVQRKAVLEAVPQIRKAKGAVITNNLLVRGVATAFSWFTSGFRVFDPSALAEAVAWLGLHQSEESFAKLAMERVKLELGDDRTRSIPRAG